MPACRLDSPAAVLAEARRRGLDVLAVTDHDTLDGAVLPAEIACREGAGAAEKVANIHQQGGIAIVVSERVVAA